MDFPLYFSSLDQNMKHRQNTTDHGVFFREPFYETIS